MKHEKMILITVAIWLESDLEIDEDAAQRTVANMDYKFISNTDDASIKDTEIRDIQFNH